MKRTNLIVDEKLLKTAKELSGSNTYSDTVNQALAQFIQVAKIRRLADSFGSGIWQGDLAAMRQDASTPRRPKRGA